jgi:hypothetical protein
VVVPFGENVAAIAKHSATVRVNYLSVQQIFMC